MCVMEYPRINGKYTKYISDNIKGLDKRVRILYCLFIRMNGIATSFKWRLILKPLPIKVKYICR